MKEKSKWYVMGALVISLILLAPLTVAASGTGAATESEEVMQISWVVKPASGEDTTWWLQELATKFNVEVIPNGVDPYDREKVAIMVSSGEFPDAGYVNQNPVKMYRDGVIRGIPKDMIREHMPDYSALLDSDYPFAWSHTLNPDNNDEVLVLHSIEDFSNTGLFYLGFRGDWARKVGVDLPDYDQTKRALDRFGRVYFYDRDVTLDWFEDLLVAFRDGDPDGNGKNDTIPFGPFQWLHWSFDPIAGAYGISFFNHFNHLVDGELYHWAISPAYKDFLLRMTTWYEMGLIDQEFPSLERLKHYEKVGNGLIGTVVANVNYPGMPYAVNRPPNNFIPDEELGSGAEVVIMPPPIGPTGLRGTGSLQPYSGLGLRNKFMINREVDDAKLAMILRIVDYSFYGDDEVWIGAYYGKPDVHFTWEGEPWGSLGIKTQYDEVPAGYPKDGGLGTFALHANLTRRIKFTHPKHLADFYTSYLLTEAGRSVTLRPYRYDVFTETGFNDVLIDHGATLTTLQNEFFFKGITGEIDINAEWDSYVARWRGSGGDQLLAELGKAPIVEEVLGGR
jgi:ABC-type glycerol-3-phosphate transport system substrate-binding protein